MKTGKYQFAMSDSGHVFELKLSANQQVGSGLPDESAYEFGPNLGQGYQAVADATGIPIDLIRPYRLYRLRSGCLDTMTRGEKALLMYAECMCVDHGGIYSPDRLSSSDRKVLETWKELGFCDYGKVVAADGSARFWLRLSEEAIGVAHEARLERARRMQSNRDWVATSELHQDQ